MNKKVIELSKLIEALEFAGDECRIWVDIQTGSVVLLSCSLINAVEEGDEELLASMADWEKEDVALAKTVLEDSGERFWTLLPSRIFVNIGKWNGLSAQ